MKKVNKNLILLALMFLVIGFATITTTLFINGKATVSENRAGCDTIFESAILDGTDISNTAITNNGHTLTFDTPVLKSLGDKSKMNFTMKTENAYDAEIDVECTTTNLDNIKLDKSIPELIYRNSTEKGYINVELKHQVTENVTGKITCELKSKCVNTTKLHIYIDPNGGEYNGTSEVSVYTHEDGESEVLDTDKLTYSSDLKFAGWYDENNNRVDIDSEGNILNRKDLILNGVDIKVTAKWEQLVSDEDAVARIKETGVNFATIQVAIDKATNGQNILLLKSTTESPTNNKEVTLDLDGHTVTGTVTNENKLTVVNENETKTGSIKNNETYAIYNKGEFTLGVNDDEINTYGDEVTVAIIGNTYGLYADQNKTRTAKSDGLSFNFYDGYLEGNRWGLGGVKKLPKNNFIIVDYDEETENQIAYLTGDLGRAVAENDSVYYTNLASAITTASTNSNILVNAVDDFEAPYLISLENDKSVIFNIAGHIVKPGYAITNNGNFEIKDDGDSTGAKGKLVLAKTFENNGHLSINNILINAINNNNLIKNNERLQINNSTVQALNGYALVNADDGIIELDNNTYIKSNTYGVYDTSSVEESLSGGNIYGLVNNATLTINDGNYYNYGNNPSIDNLSNLKINNINLTSTKLAIKNEANLNIINGNITGATGIENTSTGVVEFNNGEITTTGVTVANGEFTMNGGTIKSTTSDTMQNVVTAKINNGNVISDKGKAILTTDRGSTTINGGKIKGKTRGIEGYYRGVYLGYSSSITINGGTIESDDIGIYAPAVGGVATANGYTKINGGSIFGVNEGIRTVGRLEIGTSVDEASDIHINSNKYGINASGTVIIGKNGTNIDIESPEIMGGSYGIYKSGGTLNIYDGIFKGKVGHISGIVDLIPDATYFYEINKQNDDDYQTEYLKYKDPFVQVGDDEKNTFSSLQQAINSIETEGKVKMIKSTYVKFPATVPSGKTITLDLAGFEYGSDQSIINNGTLNIKDSSTEKTGILTSNLDIYILNNTGTLTFKAGKVYKNVGGYAVKSTGTFNLDGGIIEGKSGFYNSSGTLNLTSGKIESNGIAIYQMDISSATPVSTSYINGGEVISKGDNAIDGGAITVNGGRVISEQAIGIIPVRGQAVTVNGGYVYGKTRGLQNPYHSQSMGWSGFINVNGGTIESDEVGIYQDYVGGWEKNNGYTIINGGTIIGGKSGVETHGRVDIAINSNFKDIYIKGNIYGINKTGGILNIGINDSTIYKDEIIITGGNVGLKIDSGTTKVYDGIFKGIVDGYTGVINEIPDATIIFDDTETIDNIDYNIDYILKKTPFVQVGDDEKNTFSSLQEAIDSIEVEGKMKLIGSTYVKFPTTVPSGKTITLDLAGLEYGSDQSIINNGTLNIKDSSTEKTGILTSNLDIYILNNTGTLTFEGGKVYKNVGGYVLINSGTFNLDGGVIEGKSGFYNASGTLNIDSGKIESNGIAIYQRDISTATPVSTSFINGGEVISKGDNAIDGGEITVNGGRVISEQAIGIIPVRGQAVTVNGGYVYGKTRGLQNPYHSQSMGWSGFINVNGGTIESDDVAIYQDYVGGWENNNGYTIINGGTINGANIGVYTQGRVDIGTNNAKFNDITITGGKYGVDITNGVLNLGINDTDIKMDNFKIKGELIGLYIQGGSVNYYDGLLIGKTKGYSGDILNILTDGMISSKTEDDYEVRYLKAQTNFISNTTLGTSYYNLNTAFSDARDGDKFELTDNADIYYNVINDKDIEIDLKGKSILTSHTITSNGSLNLYNTSSDVSSITTRFGINLLVINNNATINNISLSSAASDYYALNITGSADINNLTVNAPNGIKKTGNLNISIANTNVTSTKIGLNSDSNLNIENSTISGNTYSVYLNSTGDNTLSSSTLTSSDKSLYATNSGVYTVNEVRLNGNVVNNSLGTMNIDKSPLSSSLTNNGTGTITYKNENIGGVVINKGVMNIENVQMNLSCGMTFVDNQGTVDINKLTANQNDTCEYRQNILVSNSGSTTIHDSKYTYSHYLSNWDTVKVYKNTGILESYDNEFTLTGAEYGYYLENTGTAKINNDVLTDNKTGTFYAFNNNNNLEVESIDFNINSVNTAYGAYSNSVSAYTKLITGSINLSANNSYGAYVNLGILELGVEDGPGALEEDVSKTTPSITAIGKNIGYGIYQVDGYLYYYDGTFKGSTAGKNKTVNLIEDGYEATPYMDELGNEYYVLEYMDIRERKKVSIGETKYSSLYKAYEAAQDGDTIVLNDNVSESIRNTKNIKLNLNKFTLSGAITNEGTMEVINGNISSLSRYAVKNIGTMTIGRETEEYDVEITSENIGIESTGTLNLGNVHIIANQTINGSYNNISGLLYPINSKYNNNNEFYFSNTAKTITNLNESAIYDYNGGEQLFVSSVPGIYKLEVWGAQGGSASTTYIGGYGGYSVGEIHLSQNETLFINVGGQGQSGLATISQNYGDGGYNGGGSRSGYNCSTCKYYSAGGGGATHIAKVTGLLETLDSERNQIIIVAGGGGGNGSTDGGWNINSTNIASGGGISGLPGNTNANHGGVPGSLLDIKYFGRGNNCGTGGVCDGGGGGYSGGSTGLNGAGGGSGFIGNDDLNNKYMYTYCNSNCDEYISTDENTLTNVTTDTNLSPIANTAKKGTGYAKITLISID